jgi:tRNA wybutosine-synthesizing protein 1
VLLFYATETNTARTLAEKLKLDIEASQRCKEVVLRDISSFEVETFSTLPKDTICLFVMATYEDGKPAKSADWFYAWLREARYDFRVSKTMLENLLFAVFGLGNSLYKENYNVVGRNVDLWFGGLGARRMLRFAKGDRDNGEVTHCL